MVVDSGTSGTMGRGVSRVTWKVQYVRTWERGNTRDVPTYRRTDVPTYSTITIGRSYIFKYTVLTVK